MSLVPKYRVKIYDAQTGEGLDFDFLHEFESKQTWKQLTQTATITMPRKVFVKGSKLLDVIKRGQRVEVFAGYDGKLYREFIGWVDMVEPKMPVVIHCEDDMWVQKQISHKKAWRSISLKQLVAEIFPGIKTDVVDAELGAFRIDNLNGAKVLDKIKETYGIVSYFRNGVLCVGFAYPTKYQVLEYNMQGNVIDNNLAYRTKDEVKLKVKAISMLPDGKKIEVTLGDDQGDERTLHYYNLNKAQLQKQAEAEMDKLEVSGLQGSMITFGEPWAEHGDVAHIFDNEYPDLAGQYFIDTVTKSGGMNGYRRKLEIGGRAA